MPRPARSDPFGDDAAIPGSEFLRARSDPVIRRDDSVDPRLPRLPGAPRLPRTPRPPTPPISRPRPEPSRPTRPDPPILDPPVVIPGDLPDIGDTTLDRTVLDVVDLRLLRRFLHDPPPVLDIGAGTPTRPIVVDNRALERLVREGLTEPHRTVVWTGPGRELLVRLGGTRVAAVAGGVAFGFDVESGDGRTTASVMLSIGRATAPTGMIASAGDVELPSNLKPWSEAVVAASWKALLATAVRLASQAGKDPGGRPFVPVGIYAEDGHVGVVPRARHRWER